MDAANRYLVLVAELEIFTIVRIVPYDHQGEVDSKSSLDIFTLSKYACEAMTQVSPPHQFFAPYEIEPDQRLIQFSGTT